MIKFSKFGRTVCAGKCFRPDAPSGYASATGTTYHIRTLNVRGWGVVVISREPRLVEVFDYRTGKVAGRTRYEWFARAITWPAWHGPSFTRRVWARTGMTEFY